MADLPSKDDIELSSCEIYEESRHPDDGLIWLSSDEEAPTLAETAETFETMRLNVRGSEALLSERPVADPFVNLVPAGILFGSLLLRRKTFAPFSLTRRLFRVAALVSVLLIGSVLPSILGHLRPTRVKASAEAGGPSIATQSAGRPMARPVRVLTVMAGRQETVKDISIRYVGHFDDDVFEEIRKLNPDLKDPDHLEDGQLIRIPLRAATPVN